ncbi:MAG: hypothetical protein CM1200mP2_26570 [Planctomycetaceae bacterium]|nr:MAG: hypothetical protein CM1200mP2_26570 [Planctomycetaceae bacterium]
MNSSPVSTWAEFDSDRRGPIYTFATNRGGLGDLPAGAVLWVVFGLPLPVRRHREAVYLGVVSGIEERKTEMGDPTDGRGPDL